MRFKLSVNALILSLALMGGNSLSNAQTQQPNLNSTPDATRNSTQNPSGVREGNVSDSDADRTGTDINRSSSDMNQTDKMHPTSTNDVNSTLTDQQSNPSRNNSNLNRTSQDDLNRNRTNIDQNRSSDINRSNSGVINSGNNSGITGNGSNNVTGRGTMDQQQENIDRSSDINNVNNDEQKGNVTGSTNSTKRVRLSKD